MLRLTRMLKTNTNTETHTITKDSESIGLLGEGERPTLPPPVPASISWSTQQQDEESPGIPWWKVAKEITEEEKLKIKVREVKRLKAENLAHMAKIKQQKLTKQKDLKLWAELPHLFNRLQHEN